LIEISNGLIPVISTITIIAFFMLLIGAIDKYMRQESISSYKESLRNFRVVRIFKINFLNTSLFSLILSLIRFNIIFYLVIKTVGNMLFGSDVFLFNLNYVISYIIVCEFLFFLKTKKKNEINELSSLTGVIVFVLATICLQKLSTNLIIERKVFWLGSNNYFADWTALEFPVIVIPMFYILASLYTRVVKSSVALRYNSVDRLFDFLSNNLLYIYMTCFFLRALFGGVTDIKVTSLSEYIYLNSIVSVFLKFSLITLMTRLLIRFLPSIVDLRRKSLTALIILLIINITIVQFIRGGL